MTPELSPTMRDYLAEIYRLAERAPEGVNYVGTSALAEMVNVSAPAVNRMVTRLKELGLLHHEPYQGIKLTEAGRKAALRRLRMHRIAEAFLVDVMGFSWDEVYKEAYGMSSNMSEAIAQRMLEMAKHPVRCPHGEPIPDVDAGLPELDDVRLSEAEIDTHYTITRVLTREPDRLQYLAALGLVPGARLQLIHIAPFSGPMQLKIGNEYRIIGHNLAELIKVEAEHDG
jgi:DtxR family Mn-dependent transcriptional regulator